VADGTDWWVPHYPADNLQRPTGPTCDGCHSVNYDVRTRQVTEWNVGCEKCHGPGGEHAASPARANIFNPARVDPVHASDCIQCHCRGSRLTHRARYHGPVGFIVVLTLSDFWRLEEAEPGKTTFTHFADGSAHKNRMQGNDFVTSLMYQRGVTCFTCHDVHGTEHNADLVRPASTVCLQCHGPASPNGPHTRTIEQHTHHAAGTGQRVRRVSHAEDRAGDRRRDGAQPHLPLHPAVGDREAEGAECVHDLPHRQVERVGE
jgi:predicted CXXCH cytochrome family protein